MPNITMASDLLENKLPRICKGFSSMVKDTLWKGHSLWLYMRFAKDAWFERNRVNALIAGEIKTRTDGNWSANLYGFSPDRARELLTTIEKEFLVRIDAVLHDTLLEQEPYRPSCCDYM